MTALLSTFIDCLLFSVIPLNVEIRETVERYNVRV